MIECTFIIFGATGDLSKRMLVPALYKLIADKKIKNFALVGVSLSNVSVHEMLDQAKPFIDDIDPAVWSQLLERTVYYQADVTRAADFVGLKACIEAVEKKFCLPGNRLLYCAVAADFFCAITQHVGNVGILKRCATGKEPWHRIVYEKPFGYDSASAHQINACVQNYVCEDQVFRIDHYLTKELVANIALLRFTNIIFEPLWNKNYIDRVHITLAETLDVEGRGGYYDRYGVLRDVVQNHVLQLLALIAMEQPAQLTGTAIQERKVDVIRKIVVDGGVLGQYTGYHREPGVALGSITPTYALLRLFVDTPRWEEVPFYITAGKMLKEKETTIVIKFKEIVCPLEEGRNCPCNYLTIRIAPYPAVELQLNIKPFGVAQDLHPVVMDFSYQNFFGPRTPAAYEILLEQVMQGEQAVCVRADEIEYAWRVIEHIEALGLPVYPYAEHSDGPGERETFSKRYHTRWRP